VRAAALGLAAGLSVLATAASGPPARRPAALGDGIPRRPGGLARLGSRFRRVGHLDPSPLPDGALGALVPASLLAFSVAPVLPILLIAAVWCQARVRARRVRWSAERAIAQGLPDVVDLFLLCLGAGLSLPLAHPVVAARSPAPLAGALRAADVAATGGRPRADALVDALTPLGERAALLGRTLGDHLRYGTPLEPGLERLSLELRLDRRRRAEEDVRRVPVRLLAPLVSCILPAFGLLTVVPLLAASLQSLPR
jgi:Flp pilus assembly protein TadB